MWFILGTIDEIKFGSLELLQLAKIYIVGAQKLSEWNLEFEIPSH